MSLTLETKGQYPWSTLTNEDRNKPQQRIFLFYGPSGVGKTTLSAQFPKPLILACDPGSLGGALSALKYKPKHLKINSYQEILNLLPMLKESAWKEFDTLIIDSITYMGKIVMDSILEQNGREVPRFEEWGLNSIRVAKLINQFADIGTHLIFTAVDTYDKDESGRMYGGPSLPGKLMKTLPQACDVVLKLYVQSGFGTDMKRKIEYKFQSVPDDIWFARDRTGLLPVDGVLATNPASNLESPIKRFFEPLFNPL